MHMCLSENVVKADDGISPLGIGSILCIHTETERDLLKKQIIECLKAFVLWDQQKNGEYFLSLQYSSGIFNGIYMYISHSQNSLINTN